jgi:hypothetical protein
MNFDHPFYWISDEVRTSFQNRIHSGWSKWKQKGKKDKKGKNDLKFCFFAFFALFASSRNQA